MTISKEDKLRTKAVDIADKSSEVLADFLADPDKNDARIPYAMKLMNLGIKVSHMNQTRMLQKRSLDLRTAPFLPDKESQLAYIKATQYIPPRILRGRPI